MDRKLLSVSKKLEILSQMETSGSLAATVREHNLQANQIRY